jgi:4'-phosphopantetheinyl transferase
MPTSFLSAKTRAGTVRLVGLRTEHLFDKEELFQLIAGMAEEDRARIMQLRRLRDQQNSFLAATMAKRLLAEMTGSIQPVIKRNRSGRPYLANPSDGKGDFNCAHSGEWVLCGATADGRIGVDIEKMEPLPAEVTSLFLSTEEERELAECPSDQRLAYLYETWTLKEAFLKATGAGIAYPLPSLTIEKTSRNEAKIKLADGRLLHRWHLRLYRLELGYMAAACSTSLLPDQITQLTLDDLFGGEERSLQVHL